MSDTDPARQPPPTKRRVRWWLFLFLILMLAAVAAAGWFGWHITRMRIQAQNAKLTALRNSLQHTSQELAKLRQSTKETNSGLQQQSEKLKTLQSDISHIRHDVERLDDAVKGGRAHVKVDEIGQLLHTANQSIELNKDPTTARTALREASRMLSSLGNPRFFPVQKIIASELVALQSVQKPDITTAVLEMSQLISQISRLPIQSQALSSPDIPLHPKNAESTSKEGWVTRSWIGIKKALSALFRVRHSSHTIVPMLTTSQRSLVAEVLSLRLDTARAALIQRDQAAFGTTLQSAIAWLNRYYEPKSDAVSAMRAELVKLEAMNLSPKLPDISQSLEVFLKIKRSTSTGGNND